MSAEKLITARQSRVLYDLYVALHRAHEAAPDLMTDREATSTFAVTSARLADRPAKRGPSRRRLRGRLQSDSVYALGVVLLVQNRATA